MAKEQFFRLIDGSNVFGEVEAVPTEHGVNEILIKQPWTAVDGTVQPYMLSDMASAPGAVQIHPMNVLWTVPLDEFPEAEKMYRKHTSRIITPDSNIIV